MSRLMPRGCFDPQALALASEAFSRSWSFVGRDPVFAGCDREALQAELGRVIFELLEQDECAALDIANRAIRRLRERMPQPEPSLP
jgi:hypothetical protein